MEIGIDSFAAATGNDGKYLPSDYALELLLERMYPIFFTKDL